ncbi:uracil-DNA glycosylase family protein [Fructobacillus sp. M1-13]|uniref:Uracil-DNA glycosylase family protein n=1 Tax=Fructobacillus papyriferae TaxID=2713171 RepID=A0ABS5QNE2_9LACO|nr:uracil-DNA glycosylase family protein [Fructobacillus papyriferae]MBS9334629.1 uracil-DNA glycosylase family protein [Fructobacillus papyriferae]MCD2158619.1 uracil-DNA glycosylase family protein [Fructobacillus papyriferae]
MSLFEEIKADPMNQSLTKQGLDPIYAAPKTAKIIIIGQAPGRKVQETGIMFNDASGDRLREWMGISKDEFYRSGDIGVVPMDFYYPGKAKSGDKAPRKGIADKWHPRLLEQMPDRQLIILVGSYAQKKYLDLPSSAKITDTIRNFEDYLPEYFPIVHPSPRNNIWLSRNPWYERDVIPALQKRVKEILGAGKTID